MGRSTGGLLGRGPWAEEEDDGADDEYRRLGGQASWREVLGCLGREEVRYATRYAADVIRSDTDDACGGSLYELKAERRLERTDRWWAGLSLPGAVSA